MNGERCLPVKSQMIVTVRNESIGPNLFWGPAPFFEFVETQNSWTPSEKRIFTSKRRKYPSKLDASGRPKPSGPFFEICSFFSGLGDFLNEI